MLERIKEVSGDFLRKTETKRLYVVSHFDTDGITSAAITLKTLKNLEIKFTLKIVKGLQDQFIKKLPKDEVILFLDLASNSLDILAECQNEDIYIIDHHEITQDIPNNVHMINPHLHNKEKISTAGLAYLFCKEIDHQAKDSARLAVIGMVGDLMERSLGKLNNQIVQDAKIVIKRGLLLYPSTRPIDRILEFSSSPYLPGITGNPKGIREFLREVKIEKLGNKYKSLVELEEDEMTRLITGIMLRRTKNKHDEDLIGNIYLVKLFGKLEDARELSAKINACSRLGESHMALLFCMENSRAKKQVSTIYAKYRQHIIAGLNLVKELPKIEGQGYIIINAKDEIKDTIAGTIASILSHSSLYEEGTVIAVLAHDKDKIKVSARLAGRNGRNVRQTIEKAMAPLKGEFGGHSKAAGCLINKADEQTFIQNLKNALELEVIKIQ